LRWRFATPTSRLIALSLTPKRATMQLTGGTFRRALSTRTITRQNHRAQGGHTRCSRATALRHGQTAGRTGQPIRARLMPIPGHDQAKPPAAHRKARSQPAITPHRRNQRTFMGSGLCMDRTEVDGGPAQARRRCFAARCALGPWPGIEARSRGNVEPIASKARVLPGCPSQLGEKHSVS